MFYWLLLHQAELTGVQCRMYSVKVEHIFLVVWTGKVGCNIVGETEGHKRMTVVAIALCTIRLMKLAPDCMSQSCQKAISN